MNNSQATATRTLFFEHTGQPSLSSAMSDFVNGWARHELWLAMAWEDIKQRYRGSILGPFWVTITMGVMIAVLSAVYGSIFRMDLHDYLPYLTLGLLIWTFIVTSINESTVAFIQAQRYVKQIRLPLSLFIYRLTTRNLILLAHNSLVYVVVAAIFGLWPGWAGLLAIPGLVLLVVNIFCIGLFIGMLSARFRDFPQIVASVVQVAFYITPILWHPSLLKTHLFVLVYNPVYYAIELIRRPLLGEVPPLGFYKAALLVTAVSILLALPFFRRFRARVAYWV